MNEIVIETENLTKTFGNFTAVNHISFKVFKGEIFGFLGANGAGKTTAMRMLCGLSKPTSGKGKVAGFDIYRQAENVKENIGYMSQKFSLYEDLKVWENIRLFAGIYGMNDRQISEKTNILLKQLGFESERNTLVKELPLGWKQKLAFSVSIFHEPKIVFLDEPTGGVDPSTRRQFWELIYQAADRGITVFVTTHYMDEAEYCNRVSIMVDGRIDALDTPKNLKQQFKAESMEESGKKEAIERTAKELFIQSVHQTAELIAEQLYSRYQYQRTALARQFPFMMGNDVWKGGGKLAPNDQVGDVLRQGTLGIGFIGGHNAMMALYGESHGHSRKAWDTLYEAVLEMNKVADDYKAKYQLNFSVLATPAEGLSGRFTRMDRRKYGTIPGVTDNDYYVNSFHVDVKESITIVDKIKREAPFHAITRGGHITYVELDGEAQKNIKAIAKIVKVMHDEGIGYGSINHPVDTCHNCGYKGVIYDKCPVCQSENILRMRRITGYLTGDLSTWNSAKRAEERDRVKHG